MVDLYEDLMTEFLHSISMPANKNQLCKVGIELQCLTKKDVQYIADPTTSMSQAQRRLRTAIQR
jgi:hypothetical protein